MTMQITVPDIGADEVEITEVMVKVGDLIEKEQSLITVEGDKASMEIPSPQTGRVKEISVSVGDKVSTGSVIMIFEALADKQQLVASTASTAPTTASTTVEQAAAVGTSTTQTVYVPDIGSDAVEVTEILVQKGEKVTAEQSLITVEGDKASMEIPAPYAGVVDNIQVTVGDKVSTGSVIMQFSVAAVGQPISSPSTVSETESSVASATQQADTTVSAVTAATTEASRDNGFVDNSAYAHATPLIRRLAREFGIDLSTVKGSGRKGRVLREDIQRYVKDLIQRTANSASTSSAGGALPGLLPWPTPDFSKFGPTEEVALGRIQKISGANLHRNWVMIPHVTQFDDVDITEVEAFRKQQNVEAEQQKLNLKITPLVFVMKAVAKALEQFPRFNSSLSADGQTLTLKHYIHLGVAVDTPNGLVVPVLRDVNKKGVVELSRELTEISQKARGGKLTAADMQGGCFTISSLGGIGGTAFTPIINAPEVAILGVSKAQMKPVWNGKEFAPRLMLPLALSYDHRVIDGADGARFIRFLNQVIADIRRLVM